MNPGIGILGTSILVTLIVIGVLPAPLSEAANESAGAAKATPQHPIVVRLPVRASCGELV